MLTPKHLQVHITEDDFVEFAHFSVREYLLSSHDPKSRASNLLHAHKQIAKTCVWLLGPGEQTIPAHTLADPRSYQRDSAGPASTLLDYAIAYWATHARMVESHDQMLAGLLQNLITRTLDRTYIYCSNFKTGWDVEVSSAMLRICASQGLVSLTQMYLEMGVHADGGACTSCETPLHLASALGHADVVAVLLEYGASVSSSTYTRGETALHLAAAHGSLDTFKMLLENKAEINATDSVSKSTPLHAAAAFGHLDLVKLLLEHDVDVNAALTQTGETPLHLAVLGGHLRVVSYLLGGINVSSEEFALYESVVHKPYFKTFSEGLLLGYGNGETIRSDGRLRYDAEEDMLRILACSKRHIDINVSTREGWTPLHLAAIKGHDAVLQLLIDNGADLSAKGKDQCTPLELAAENGHLSIVEHLIAAGADMNADAGRQNLILRRVAENGHHDIADLLMWKVFIAKIPGATHNWPVLRLAALSRQHTVESAMNRNRYTNASKRLYLQTRLRL